jgi:branched-chain amino acid transport system substrate-binding protein
MPTTQPPRAKFTRRSFLKIAGTAGVAASAGPLLAACAPQAAGPAATATPLPSFKLGLLVPYSDIYAVLGESITEAMKMYFDSIGNTAGGRKIEIVAEDEGTQPEPALEKARKLVEQDKVDMVAGIVSSGVANALRDYFDESQRILIIANAGANPLTRDRKSKYIFRTSFSNWQPNWPLGSWAYANVGKRAFISVPDYAAGHDMESAFLNSFLAAGGQVVGKPQYTPFPNMGDPEPFITEIQAANPDLVFAFYSGGAAVNFVKAYGDFGLTGKIPFVCAGFAVEEDVLPAQGQAALGAKSGLHWALLLDNPENKAFTAAYKQRTSKDANTFAVQGYDTAHVIGDALNAVQGDTSNADRLIEAIAGVSFNGPRGAFKFDPVTHNIIQHIYIRNVQEVDGALHNVVLEDAGEVADPGDNSKG